MLDTVLVTLVYQLQSVKKLDLAISVLELNLHFFPGHLYSLIFLAKLCLLKDDNAQAKAVLQKVLTLDPKNRSAAQLLEKIR